MARIQYQGSARAGGYRSLQVDERNVARLREESARQIEGMRQAANAEIQNRKEISQQMKEDAAYTARAEERNFQILTQNSQRQMAGLRAQAARDQQQAAINQKETQALFENISNFSVTAGKLVNHLQEQREEEEFERDVLTETDQDERVRDTIIEQAARESDLQALFGVSIAEANGADPTAASKIKNASSVLKLDAAAGHLYKYATEQHQPGRDAFIKQAEEQLGRVLTFEEKKRASGIYTSSFIKAAQASGLSKKFLKRIMGAITQSDNTFIAQINRQIKQRDDAQTVETSLTNVLQASPEDRQKIFITSYNYVASILGHSKALETFQDRVFTARNAKGEFALTEEEIGQLPFFTKDHPNGITFKDKFSNKDGAGRYADVLRERLRIRNQDIALQQQSDKLSHAQLEDTLARAAMENPTLERVQEAQRMYTAATFRESPKLAIIEKSLTYEAQHKQNIVKAVTNLRDFELTPEIVAAAVAADPTKGKAVKDRYDAYNAKWKSDGYKKANKSLETVVSGTTSFGTTKAAEAGSLPMIGYLQSQLKERTALYETTLGFQGAHEKAAAELALEYRNGYRDKTSPYYRKVLPGSATVSYPNLPVGNVSAAEQVKRDVNALRTSVKTIGVEGVLDTPLSVTSAERLEYIKKNFYKDTFKPTPKELAFIGMSKGMPLHEAYNRFFQANGDPFRLNSPLRLNGQEVTLTPEDQKILGDPTKGPQAKLSVINRILNPGMFQTAQSMRPGSPFLVYTSGNIGPTSTGPHLDVKQVGGGEFAPTALDQYIEVDDPELGVVPLSRVPITGDFASHTARGSHGIDYGLHSGTKIYAKNGARLIGTRPSEHGDVVTIQLPDGKQYTFLHGKAAK